MDGSAVDKLLGYIERCGETGFRERIRGADPALLAELERLYRGPLPADYLEYARAMGGDAAGFHLYSKDDGGFADVVDFYRRPDEPDELPRGGSILIAIGDVEQFGIDGTLPGERPVGVWAGGRFEPRLADSFEAYCLQRAWWLFRYPRFAHNRQVIVPRCTVDKLEEAVCAARRAGLDSLDFSDSRNRYLDGEDTACVRWVPDGNLYINAASHDEDLVEALASSIARYAAEAP